MQNSRKHTHTPEKNLHSVVVHTLLVIRGRYLVGHSQYFDHFRYFVGYFVVIMRVIASTYSETKYTNNVFLTECGEYAISLKYSFHERCSDSPPCLCGPCPRLQPVHGVQGDDRLPSRRPCQDHRVRGLLRSA